MLETSTNGAGAGVECCRRPRRPAWRSRAGIRGWRARRAGGGPGACPTRSWSSRPSAAGSRRSTRRGSWPRPMRARGRGRSASCCAGRVCTRHIRRTGGRAQGSAMKELVRRAGVSRSIGVIRRSRGCRRRAERSEAELSKMRRVVEIQGNLSALLEQMLGTETSTGAPSDDRADRRRALAVPRRPGGVPGGGRQPATIYRRRRRPEPAGAAAADACEGAQRGEREPVLEVLHSERFVDVSPEEFWATLLDEGPYLCPTRTMYRILAARHGGVRERRNQLTHPGYARPELLAERPNELWSWDISKPKGPARDLLLPLRDPRRVQPLHRRLDGPAPRDRASSPRR